MNAPESPQPTVSAAAIDLQSTQPIDISGIVNAPKP
jgi:hypothetical protein